MTDGADDCRCDCQWLEKRLNRGGGGGGGEGDEEEGVVVLDCRSVGAYRRGHIAGALHLALPTLMMRRLVGGNLPVASVVNCLEGRERLVDGRWKSGTVVLHDESTENLSAEDDDAPPSPLSQSSSSGTVSSSSSASWMLLRILLKRLKEDGCDARLLRGGFVAFSRNFPDLCVGSTKDTESTIIGLRYLHLPSSSSSPPSSPSSGSVVDGGSDGGPVDSPNGASPFPVEVLPHLYLGNATNSADLVGLCRNGIRYILNATANVPNVFEGNHLFRYLQIPIDDHWSQSMVEYFPQAIAFIEDARRKKCGVLVHCLAGISRSVTITVAYLMYSLSLSLNDAYDHVKRRKPNISPNFSFMGQLMDFERSLRLERGPAFAVPAPTSLGSAPSSISSAPSSSISSAPPSISSAPSSSLSSASSLGSASSCGSSSAYSSASPATGRPDSAHCDDDNRLQLRTCFPSLGCNSLSSLSTSSSATTASSLSFDYDVPSTHS